MRDAARAIAERIMRGETLKEVAASQGVSKAAIFQKLERSGYRRCRICLRGFVRRGSPCAACEGVKSVLLDREVKTAEAARISGFSEQKVRKVRKKLGAGLPHRGYKLPDPLPEDILDPLSSTKHLAEKYGVSRFSISRKRKKAGVTGQNLKLRRPWTPEEEAVALRMRSDGVRLELVAAKVGRTPVAVASKIEALRRKEKEHRR